MRGSLALSSPVKASMPSGSFQQPGLALWGLQQGDWSQTGIPPPRIPVDLSGSLPYALSGAAVPSRAELPAAARAALSTRIKPELASPPQKPSPSFQITVIELLNM